MICSMISDMKKQRSIAKDINALRHINRELEFKDLLLKVNDYYVEKKYSEDILLKRRAKLKKEALVRDTIYSGGVGAFVGLMIGFLSADKLFPNLYGIVKFVSILVYSFFTVIVFSLIISFITKYTYRSKKINDYYLDSKELELIERILEGDQELTTR